MLNLSNRENLSLTCFEKSLDDLLIFCKDEEQVALDIIENPKDTVTRLRTSLEAAHKAMKEFKSEVLAFIPTSHAAAKKQKELMDAAAALKNAMVTAKVEYETKLSQLALNSSNNHHNNKPGSELKVFTSGGASPQQQQQNQQIHQEQQGLTTPPGSRSVKFAAPNNQNENQQQQQGFFPSIFAPSPPTSSKQTSGRTTATASRKNSPKQKGQQTSPPPTSSSDPHAMSISASFFGPPLLPNATTSSTPARTKTKTSASTTGTTTTTTTQARPQNNKENKNKNKNKSKKDDHALSSGEDDEEDDDNHHIISSDDDLNSDDDYFFDPVTLNFLPKDPSKKLSSPRVLSNKMKKKRYLQQQHQIMRNKHLRGGNAGGASSRRAVSPSSSSYHHHHHSRTRSSSPDEDNMISGDHHITSPSSSRRYKTDIHFIHPTQYLSIGTHFFLELLARQTLAREVILYKYKPGDSLATVVNLFCVRPQIELFADVSLSESLVGRVISSGVAVNISPESPTETNVPRLIVPIFSTAQRTAVVGAVLLQHRVCGGCFSATEETITAAWGELAAHLVQQPAILKGKPRPMTNVSTKVPTSLATAVDQYLPKRGKTVANILLLQQQQQQQSGSTAGISSLTATAAAAAAASMTTTTTQHQHHSSNNNNVDESLVFDPFSSVQSSYRSELWSTICLHETIELNYKEKFDQMRKEKLDHLFETHKLNKKIAQNALTSARRGIHQAHEIDQMGNIDRYVNSTFLSSLHDITISASERISGETGAHKFLMQLCSKLYEKEDGGSGEDEILSAMMMGRQGDADGGDRDQSKNNNNNNNNNNSLLKSVTKEQLSSAQQIGAAGAGMALLQLIHSSQSNNNTQNTNNNNNKKNQKEMTAEALLQKAITENANSSVRARGGNRSAALLSSIANVGISSSSSSNNSRNNNNKNDKTQSQLLSPDDLADLVDRCKVPLLVLRSVFQDSWKPKPVSDNNNNNNTTTSGGDGGTDFSSNNNKNQRLAWYPAQRNTEVITAASKGSGKHTTATRHSSKNETTDSDNNQQQDSSGGGGDQQRTNSKPLTGTIAKPKPTGISESISAVISTLPVVDVANHVGRLEYSWLHAIEDQRATDLHHLTHLADYSKTKHKLTVVERQKSEAVSKSQEATQRYERLKNQIGMLCSKEFFPTLGASNAMSRVLPKQQQNSKGGGSPSSKSLNSSLTLRKR